jgi:homocysteine S-methyltransferase
MAGMPARQRAPITDRLERGDRLLMDGATGSELQRRGADVLRGARPEALGAWSATVNADRPDLVYQVHTDYLDLGADIIISNSFWTSRLRLETAGLADRWEEYTRAAGEIAVRARDEHRAGAYVAGGMAPPCMQGVYKRFDPDVLLIGEKALSQDFFERAKVLAETGVDFMLAEYVGHIADAVVAVDACAAARLPVLVGMRHVTIEGRLQHGESFNDLAKALRGHPVSGVLIMCSRPEAALASLSNLRKAFDGPVGVYPNIGYVPLAPLRSGPDADFLARGDYTPQMLAEFARRALDLGAQIVGGCCSTGPEHIRAMKPVVKG